MCETITVTKQKQKQVTLGTVVFETTSDHLFADVVTVGENVDLKVG